MATVAGVYGFSTLAGPALLGGKVLCFAFVAVFLLFLVGGWKATRPLP